jgi:ABC-type antimicrobial peptide transport system permease subunit
MLEEQRASLSAQELGNRATIVVPFLYFVGKVQKGSQTLVPEIREQSQVVVAGTHLTGLSDISPGWNIPKLVFFDESDLAQLKNYCFLGVKVSEKLHAQEKDVVELSYGNQVRRLEVVRILSTGGDADNRIFMELDNAQQLTNLSGRASLIEVSFPGQPVEIDKFIRSLALRLPDDEVRPVRQFTEGEAKIYNRISGLLTATVGIVLLLTALCVMAAMTNVAMERKMDVGLMKAIGGATRRVVRLFLAEAALLGLAGGLIGAAVGILLSIGLGKAVFGVAARPRLIVYPVAVALTIFVAVLSAFPLRRLASIRPASVFRGEA